LKNTALIFSALVVMLLAGAGIAAADGLGVSYSFWMPGDNGKLSQKSCTLQAAAALSAAGFRHVDTGTNEQHPVVFGDHGQYQATVFCLGDNGTVTVVVMGPDQDTATAWRKKFSAAWKAAR